MKHVSVLAALAFGLSVLSCGVRPELRSGDLVFVGLPLDYSLDTTSMSSGIVAATGDGSRLNYIHTAILEVSADSVWVIDATIKRGVARCPLDTFLVDFTLPDGSYPVFEVRRLKDGPRDLVENAKKYVGLSYNVHFRPDSTAKYCTELVRDSYLDGNGAPVFPEAPMNFKDPDGEFPPYWVQLFASLGESVPQGLPGTNPNDMRESPLLEKVDVDITGRHGRP